MPAKSTAQRKFMGAALSEKEGKCKTCSKKVKKAAEGMSKNELKEFLKR